MKKILLALSLGLLLTGCGVGSYSLSTGKADEAMLSFVSPQKTDLSVKVDDQQFDVQSVKTKAWKKDRKIKRTAKNTIVLTPGQHEVTVISKGTELYNKKVFISVQEHKVIEL